MRLTLLLGGGFLLTENSLIAHLNEAEVAAVGTRIFERDKVIGEQVEEAVVDGVHALRAADLDEAGQLLDTLVADTTSDG
jgi:hypothetical protein